MNILSLISKPGIDMTIVKKLNAISFSAERNHPSKNEMLKRAHKLLDELEKTGELEKAVRTMLLMTGADTFMPPQYHKFQKVVFEGAIFFISQLSKQRIAHKMVSQLSLPQDASTGERMCNLVTNLPTLQKLCQIICRSPGLDPDFKKSLVELEDNSGSMTYEDLQVSMTQELKSTHHDLNITLSKRILAEASVCAVVPGELHLKDTKDPKPVVMKMVKPEIKLNMAGELKLWGHLGDYLDENKEKWGLGDFKFKGIINQVSWLLQNEIDLSLEQSNLDKIGARFSDDDTVIIPECLDASTPNMTAMSRIDGNKIIDVDHLTHKQQRRIARKVAKQCILRPIIDLAEESIFHGDPHAGNMAYLLDNKKAKLIFYDWAMVGTLSRLERFSILLMISGLIIKNKTAVFYAADIMSGGQITKNKNLKKNVATIIQEVFANRQDRLKGVLSDVEGLIEALMYQGLVFSPDLLVFEKSLVTLKGVLADIDPHFSRDEYVVYMAVLQLIDDFAHLRIQKAILKEIWKLYRYSLSALFDVQRTIFKLGFG